MTKAQARLPRVFFDSECGWCSGLYMANEIIISLFPQVQTTVYLPHIPSCNRNKNSTGNPTLFHIAGSASAFLEFPQQPQLSHCSVLGRLLYLFWGVTPVTEHTSAPVNQSGLIITLRYLVVKLDLTIQSLRNTLYS
jgi:hypothetical protein